MESVQLAQALSSTSSGATINSNGTISTQGGSANGINSTGTSAVITNSGTISTQGEVSLGISITGDHSSVTNSGKITTSAANGHGIFIGSGASSAVVKNTGFITTSSAFSSGIFSSGSSASITNEGTVTASSSNGLGAVYIQGASSVFNNYGTVVSWGANNPAVSFSIFGSNAVLNNAGTIKNTEGLAIQFEGSNPSLSILFGSNIQGNIQSSADPLNLKIEEGINIRLTIDDSSNGFGSLNIGSPYVTVGNTETLSAIDRTGFVLQADVLEDLSDSVLDAIYRRRFPYLHCCYPCSGVWGQAIGSYRMRKENIHYHNSEVGGLAGCNWAVCDFSSLGLFAGGTYGTAKIERDTQEAQISTGLAGLTYEQMCRNIFFGFSLTSGYVGWENRRTVLNNLAPGGVQEAKASIHGWMISPEISSAGWLSLGSTWSAIVSGSFKYAGLFLGSYSEAGSAADFSIEGRHVDLLKVRAELGLSGYKPTGCICWNIEPYIGVAGRFQVGGNRVSGELLGQDLSFSVDEIKNLVELLFGLRGEEVIGPYTLFANIQGLFDNKNSSRVLAEVGASYSF